MSKKDINLKQSRAGFTIVELLLATLVFSAVVVVAMSGFLTIGRLFYKGVNQTQTQATIQDIISSLSSDIQSTSIVSNITPASGGRSYLCIGNNRYIFKLHKMVDITNHDNNLNFGLLRDSLPGNSPCANPYDGPSAVPPQNPEELLTNKMRLNSFNVAATCANCKLYALDVNIAFGDDGSLDIDPTTQIATCDSGLSSSQYCSVTKLSAAVASGL